MPPSVLERVQNSDRGRHLAGLYAESQPQSLWKTGKHVPLNQTAQQAAQNLLNWMPWGEGKNKIALDDDIRIGGSEPTATESKDRLTPAENLLLAALAAHTRYLPAGTRLGEGFEEVSDILERVQALRALQGRFAERSEKVKRLEEKLAETFERKKYRQAFKYQGQIKQLNRENEKEKERIKQHPVPIRLLAAAIDAANFNHIDHAGYSDQIKYARRMRHWHIPLLRSLGEHYRKQCDQLEAQTLYILDTDKHQKLARLRGAIQAHEEPGLKALEAYLEGNQQPVARLESRTKTIASMHIKEATHEIAEQHDKLGYRIILPGEDRKQVRELANALRHESHGLTGKTLGNMRVQAIRVNNDWLDEPKEGGYRAIHLVADVHVPGTPELKKLEIQLVNEAMHKTNTKSKTASHRVYKGIEEPPSIEAFIPPERIKEWVDIRVHGPDEETRTFKSARRLDRQKGSVVATILEALRDHRPVTIGGIVNGHIRVFTESQELDAKGRRKSKQEPVGLHEPLKDGKAYHVYDVTDPRHEHLRGYRRRLTKPELRWLRDSLSLEDWIRYINEELRVEPSKTPSPKIELPKARLTLDKLPGGADGIQPRKRKK